MSTLAQLSQSTLAQLSQEQAAARSRHGCRVITGTGALEEQKAPMVLCWKMPGIL